MKNKMSGIFLCLLLTLCFGAKIVSGTTVLTSATVTISNQPTSTAPSPSPSIGSVDSSPSIASSVQTSSQTSSAVVAVTTSIPPAKSTESIASSSAPFSVTLFPSSTAVILSSPYPPSSPSLSSPGGDVSPTSTVLATASLGTQPTKSTTSTSKTGAKGKTIGGLEIVGFVLASIVGLLVAAFGIYYIFYRKKMFPEFYAEVMVEAPAPSAPAAATKTALPEVGITHQAFEGDPGSPTKATAPEPEVKTPEPEVKIPEQEEKVAESEVPEVKFEVNENEEGEDNAGFSQDSAL